MDLFDIKLMLGVSRSHSVRDKSTVLKVFTLQILKEVAARFYRKSLTESIDSTLKSFELSRKSGNTQSPQPFEVSSYNLFIISSANNQENCQSHS